MSEQRLSSAIKKIARIVPTSAAKKIVGIDPMRYENR